MFDLSRVQAAMKELGFDGWLLYDFRGLNILARRIVGLSEEQMLSRRWIYFLPARGEPRSTALIARPHEFATSAAPIPAHRVRLVTSGMWEYG